VSNQTRTFRGKSLEEILPRIRAELGPDAVITRQREGLAGGIGGFFQKQFVEVEAHAGAPRLDLTDDSDALPDLLQSAAKPPTPHTPHPTPDPAVTEGLSSMAIQRVMEQAAPFAERLEEESMALERRAAEPLVAGRRRPSDAAALEHRLEAASLHPALAEGIVTEAVTHLLPFASSPDQLERLVLETLARRIPVQSSWTRRGRTVAFVGPGGSGKTLCTARLAAAYALGSDLPVICMSLRPSDGGEELTRLLEPANVPVHVVASAQEARARIAGARDHALTVIDTPSASAAESDPLYRLASEIEQIGVYEVHLTLPATVGERAAGDILTGLSPLGVSRIALTHADETGHVGPAVGLAISSGKPFSYIGSGTSVPGGLFPANATALAAAVLS
jgi:flagellar biosynthesis protein FlhF